MIPNFASSRVDQSFMDSGLTLSDYVPELMSSDFIIMALATALGAADSLQLLFVKDVEEVDRVLAGELIPGYYIPEEDLTD
ncbi:hypothetical protein N8342_06785 [Acidimicrobiales bacterium]|nr:hypothetical protein [bacterium]MDC1389534.1 hypothetical protein [Acidimicrobiales bacterium]